MRPSWAALAVNKFCSLGELRFLLGLYNQLRLVILLQLMFGTLCLKHFVCLSVFARWLEHTLSFELKCDILL